MMTWVLGGARYPIGKLGGALRELSPVTLGERLLRETLERVRWPIPNVSELLVGMALIEGGMMVPARQIANAAHLPDELPTLTVDRACCSGLTIVGLADRAVRDGARSVLCLGLESMSQTPRLLHDTRWGVRRGDLVAEDLLLMRSPLTGGPIAKYVGEVAQEHGVDRLQQDAWAVDSHRRFFRAWNDGYFVEEVLPVQTPGGVLEQDEAPRRDTSLEALQSLPTVYDSPTVTAGNAPGLNDGACAVVVASDDAALDSEQRPLARVHAYLQTAGSATSSAYLPGDAIARLLADAGLSPRDLDVIEINEAFAATPLVSLKRLSDGDAGLERDLRRVTNAQGGAVAIGHPTGASGARLVLTAARALAAREGRWAAVAICGGFGQTDAVLLERPS